MQRRGKTPTAGFEHMSQFQAALDKFEPSTRAEAFAWRNPARLQRADPVPGASD